LEFGKEFENFLAQIIHLGVGLASIEAFVPVCAVRTLISSQKHSVHQSLLSVKKLLEAVCRYAIFAPNRIFLSMELEVILNDNILTWFNAALFWKTIKIMYDNYVW
jgi:hypothetical protein